MPNLLAAPPLADVRRRPVRIPPQRTAAARNVRAPEIFSVSELNDQIRQSDVPSRPSRQQIVTFLAIAPYKAVMEDEFLFHTLAPSPNVQELHGRQLPWTQRVNVVKRSAEAYGSLLTLNPPDPAASLLYP
jgi:hypothetical protein